MLLRSSNSPIIVDLSTLTSSDEEEYTLTEALLETAPVTEPNRPHSSNHSLEETQAAQCTHSFEETYFSTLLFALYQQPETTPLPSSNPARYGITEHPQWTNWNSIWNSPPVELDPDIIPYPVVETSFLGVLFQLVLDHDTLSSFDTPPIFHQGTIITFKGFDSSRIRHVVEWCEQVSYKAAYLKVVANDQFGTPCAYNDPQYPSFVLEVPPDLSYATFTPARRTPQSYTSYTCDFQKPPPCTKSSPIANSTAFVFRWK
jgi:hypothetical protein